jgi:hypothetical protein
MNQREHFETEYPVPDREAFSEPLGMYVWKDYPNTVSPHNDLYDAFRDGWDAAMQHAPQPAVPDGLHQMIVDYIRDDFETLQDGGDWCVITPEDVEEQLKYLRKHDLLIQHPTDPERVMVAMLSAAKGETE